MTALNSSRRQMRTGANGTIIIRRLRSSDLGWFAEPRNLGRAAGHQRAIQFNASLIHDLLTEEEISAGGTVVLSRRAGSTEIERRPLRLNKKNWRLMGRKVEDPALTVPLWEG